MAYNCKSLKSITSSNKDLVDENPNDQTEKDQQTLDENIDQKKIENKKVEIYADGNQNRLGKKDLEKIEKLFDADSRFSSFTPIKSIIAKKHIEKNIIYDSKKGFVVNMDKKETKFLGEGSLSVPQDKVKLTARRIKYNWGNKILDSRGKPSKNDIDAPPLLKIENDIFLAKNIRYNTETEKGIIKEVITPVKEGVIQGKKIKKVNTKDFYSKDITFTTCKREDPHFVIKTKEAKIIKDDKAIVGPFWLQFGNVPAPLGFVYACFHINDKRRSGILFPDIGFKSVKGFYLNDFGYFYAINKYLGIALMGGYDSEKGDVYISIPFDYHRKYSFQGGVSYRLDMKQYKNIHLLNWKHTTLKKRGGKLTSNVEIKIEKIDKKYKATPKLQSLSNNTSKADINYSKTNFLFLPYDFNINLHHDKIFGKTIFNELGQKKDYNKMSNSEKEAQKTKHHIILPDISLQSKSLYIFNPFGKFKSNILTRVNVRHTLNFKYERSHIYDLYDFFAKMPRSLSYGKLDKWSHYGIKQTFPVSTSFTVFKYFNITPSFVWTERWYFEKFKFKYSDLKKEIIAYKMDHGFYRVGDYSTGLKLETTFEARHYFGKKKKFKAIRHKVNPVLDFTFSPGYGSIRQGYYKKIYNYWENEIQSNYCFDDLYGSPPNVAQGILSFAIKNILELKIKDEESPDEESTKTIKLLKSFDIESGYDFLALKNKWKNIILNTSTSFFNDRLNLKLKLDIDPYEYQVVDGEMRKVDEYAWNHGRYLGEIREAIFDIDFSVNSQVKEPSLFPAQATEEQYVNFDIPWNLRVAYHILYHKESYLEVNKRLKNELKTKLTDPNKKIEEIKKIREHNLRFEGELALTKKWKLKAAVLYNIIKKRYESPSIAIYRDLHCWELSMRWNPMNFVNSLEFLLRVKASILKPIKYRGKGKM